MLKMPVDNFDLEMANSNYDLLKLFQKYPFTKDITLGVVDVHRHQLENFDEVVAGIRNTLKIIPIEQVWIDPDCGLKTRSTEEAMAKLKLCVDASKALRASSR
jgi:5-methyltetrahydropteroyltriglutamate--homocysteine methyltransferase